MKTGKSADLKGKRVFGGLHETEKINRTERGKGMSIKMKRVRNRMVWVGR